MAKLNSRILLLLL